MSSRISVTEQLQNHLRITASFLFETPDSGQCMIHPWTLTTLKKHSNNELSHAEIQLKVLLLYKEKEVFKKCKLAEYEEDFVSGTDKHAWSELVSKLYQLFNNHITTTNSTLI